MPSCLPAPLLRCPPPAPARQTTGFTGADLANLVNEAALLAGRGNKGALLCFGFVHTSVALAGHAACACTVAAAGGCAAHEAAPG